MIAYGDASKWLASCLLFLLLLPGCAPATTDPNQLLTTARNVEEIEIVHRLAQEDKELVLFYYTAEGQRWLTVTEIEVDEMDAREVGRRYSALRVSDTCASPCTTYDVEADGGMQQVVLYGYTQHPDVSTVEIDLGDGRTLARSVVEGAFIATWGGPAGFDTLHKEIREKQ